MPMTFFKDGNSLQTGLEARECASQSWSHGDGIDKDGVQVYCTSQLPAVQGGLQHGGKHTRIL